MSIEWTPRVALAVLWLAFAAVVFMMVMIDHLLHARQVRRWRKQDREFWAMIDEWRARQRWSDHERWRNRERLGGD